MVSFQMGLLHLRGGQGVEIEGSVFILDDRIAEFKVIK
jgi:hypothetical protein